MSILYRTGPGHHVLQGLGPELSLGQSVVDHPFMQDILYVAHSVCVNAGSAIGGALLNSSASSDEVADEDDASSQASSDGASFTYMLASLLADPPQVRLASCLPCDVMTVPAQTSASCVEGLLFPFSVPACTGVAMQRRKFVSWLQLTDPTL